MKQSATFLRGGPRRSIELDMRQTFTYRGERWRAESSGVDRIVDGLQSVGVWFTNEETSEQIHGDVTPALVEAASPDRLADALDITLCRHRGLTQAVDAAGIMEHDVIATRRADGQFDIRQRIQGSEHFLEGPIGEAEAERRAVELASRDMGDAWIQEGPTTFRLLT